jgi:hypothetical protein
MSDEQSEDERLTGVVGEFTRRSAAHRLPFVSLSSKYGKVESLPYVGYDL